METRCRYCGPKQFSGATLDGGRYVWKSRSSRYILMFSLINPVLTNQAYSVKTGWILASPFDAALYETQAAFKLPKPKYLRV